MDKRIFFILLIVLMVAGCSPARSALQPEVLLQKGGEAMSGGGVSDRSFEVSGEPEMDSSLASYSEEGQGGTMERMVIKNANLSIVVESPSGTMDEISRMASELGGYVVSSNLTQVQTERGVEVPQARITIRVPSEKLDDALEAIKTGAGEVLSENVSGQDVTKEYTDLESRLRHLQNAEAKLTQIMDEATKTEDVLSVYNRLVEIQEEMEVVKGQMQYYEQSAALSAISVTIQANEAVQPLKIGSWQPVGVAKNAIQALINTLQFFGDAAIWLGLFVLPVLIILYFPIRYGWKGIKRLFRSRKASQEDESEKE
jgi:hypothetical protein